LDTITDDDIREREKPFKRLGFSIPSYHVLLIRLQNLIVTQSQSSNVIHLKEMIY